MNISTIEWTEFTWNPTTGCSKISSGCSNCYAENLAKRLKAMGLKKYLNEFELTLHPETLNDVLKMNKPKRIFVNSMSDLFHKDVPLDFIQKVFKTMNEAHWHTYQVLTKRADRIGELSDKLPWSENIWMGVSVENEDYLWRIDRLRETGALTKFLSIEPLLGPLPNLDLTGIDWVIVGGESGSKARAMDPKWVRDIRDQCVAEGIPFFFKQWGGKNKKKAGRDLDGRTWDEFPG